jgi:hypothetical protein
MKQQHLSRLVHIFLLVAGAAALASAQTASKSVQATADAAPAAAQSDNRTQSNTRTSADETFDLNISERRITERDFEASTAVSTNEERARGLRLRVGVGVGAEEINVLLRNVRGHVRFRASLDRVLERLNSRRNVDAVP